MRKGSAAKNNRRKKLIYVKAAAEIPDFKSEDEVADWYQTHSTVLIQDQLESLPAKVGGKLRARLAELRHVNRPPAKSPRRARSARA